MKQYPLIQVGNPRFRKTCTNYSEKEIISEALRTQIMRMVYTIRKLHGVGLAAPQVGIQKNMFVYRLAPTKFRPDIRKIGPYAVFNPVIISLGKKYEVDWEGCFSVAKADLFAKVLRPTKIKVWYLNEKAEAVERDLSGLEARIFQHEYDHIICKVFLDHKPEPSTFMSADEYRAMREKQITQ